MPLEPTRTVAELKELRELTGDEDGAQRIAWTDTWRRAQEWMADKLQGTGAETEFDEARNQWWTLRGRSERALILGGHLDSVPNGGWLDGALNVVAGSEVLRRIAEEGEPPLTVRLVSWADEGGARFGRSLFGASAASGTMTDQEEGRNRTAGGGAVCTSGGVVCKPGIVTSVVETAEQLLDQRHMDAEALARMLDDARDASQRFAAEEDLDVSWDRIWNIQP